MKNPIEALKSATKSVEQHVADVNAASANLLNSWTSTIQYYPEVIPQNATN